MTKDVIALTPRMPDLPALLAGLYAGGPGLGVDTLAEGAVVQLCATDGRPLVSVEAPVLVQVPGETVRLLGHDVPPPVWWTEARASTAVAEAGRLAGSFAGRLATVLGGTVWPPEAVTTEVVPLTTDVSAVPAPASTAPAVDVLTDRAAIVIQDRPLVAMTSWLSDALRTATEGERALQIVTPPTARLTLPARTALRGLPNRWVVQDPDLGYYDGLSGVILHWTDGAFAPVPDADGPAAPFTAAPPTDDRQLILSFRTRHPAGENLVLGGALEAAFRHLTGAPPAGWSTAEPVNLPWSTRPLTDLARSRAPRPTWLTAVGRPGRPAIATVRVRRTTGGVEEEITLAVGHGADEPVPLDAIAPLVETLAADHDLVTLLTSLRAARRDLTVPPHAEAPPVPVSLTLAVDEPHATTGPQPVRLGRALHYPLSDNPLNDGSGPKAWDRFTALMRDLRPRWGGDVPDVPDVRDLRDLRDVPVRKP
ncbi:DUF6177 family protein [Streptomyces sp. NPDC014995]|uniref:DUF6177 family protein n=1 Tax=Streptomyces sp. NPDC014995 TaxID=3364936 RepID=UPI0036FC50AC